MKTSFTPDATKSILSRLEAANTTFNARFPGEPEGRQPVHTVYGGAHLFKADSAKKMGGLALKSLDEYAPDFATLARAIGLPGANELPTTLAGARALRAELEKDAARVRVGNKAAWTAYTIHTRVVEKLKSEPIEDFRIDYEDGYGNRPNAEEDGHAAEGAMEVAKGMKAGTLPPFIGIRIKPFTEELRERSVRTLDVFLSTLAAETGGKLPANFVVTLPKVTIPEQVTALADLFDLLEPKLGMAKGTLKMEMMIETTQSIIGMDGRVALPALLDAARGRCVSAHFGTYDYTASCNITAGFQKMTHPVCDFARHMMQVSFARTGITMSDGATNVMPIGPHRPAKDGPALTSIELSENRLVVHSAWKLHYDHIQDSLMRGFYQGWDLHPAQLPIRYAAVYAFFLEGLDAASERLKNFVQKAAQATLVGDVFDDAATGQGLLNFFLRSINCGALTQEETQKLTSLTEEEIRGRSFVKILNARKG
ncbi:MAG: phosphoenolpyruvate kinase [Polyangiaceae bacterium]